MTKQKEELCVVTLVVLLIISMAMNFVQSDRIKDLTREVINLKKDKHDMELYQNSRYGNTEPVSDVTE